ncbi:hypothetical protein [Hymenobacter baengnokdamensis]|uniref:hypothetical protein n=1 Tax=Hymenobacter baengnokdamensis TaxID=2615203 RepID=UPI0012490302|nr:hypothetical protein [Hymenobacter baengnokdamensis]
MKLFLRCVAFAPLLALAASCCANNPLNCNDLQADSLYLILNSNPADSHSFSAAELDTVYLRRYSPTDSTTLSDPVTIVRAQQQQTNSSLLATLKSANLDPSTTLVISNNEPFPPSITGGKLNAYNYLLTVHDNAQGAPTYQFKINSIQLKGDYVADACSTCYKNTYKRFRVNGGPYQDVTESGGLPVAVTLSKP